MKTIINILIESSEYFTIIAGAIGIGVFVVMMLTLDLLRSLGKLFNRPYSIKKMEQTVNKRKNIEKSLYDRSKILGTIIAIASIYILFFLFVKLDLGKIMEIISIESTMQPFTLALLQTAKLFSILSTFFSGLFGLVLIFDKHSAEKISDFFNNWYSTEEIEEKLDETVFKDTDTICFLHNKFIGFLGFFASLILFGLAFFNIISK